MTKQTFDVASSKPCRCTKQHGRGMSPDEKGCFDGGKIKQPFLSMKISVNTTVTWGASHEGVYDEILPQDIRIFKFKEFMHKISFMWQFQGGNAHRHG